jgi:hypothetical protein
MLPNSGSDLFDPSLSKEEFSRRLRELAEEEEKQERAALEEKFDENSLLWLALTPGWTVQAADLCDFPGTNAGGAESLFANMREQGIAESWEQPLLGMSEPAKPPFFFMEAQVRATLLEPYRAHLSPAAASATSSTGDWFSGLKDFLSRPARPAQPERLPALRRMVSEIGQRVCKLPDHIVPPALARWARLARTADDGATLAACLDQQTQEAARNGLVEAVREIHDDMEAVKPLAWLMGEDGGYELQLAMQRAARRLELLQRRERDEQHLTHFLERREHVEAFFELMDGPPDQWALHLAGAGGVGKTMLIRHIAAVLTGDTPFKAPTPGRMTDRRLTDVAVARIDFDYLNADYPSLAPGLLLWSFGQELRAYDNSNGFAISRFDEADRVLDRLHKQMRAEQFGSRESPTRMEPFIEAVGLYIEGINSLNRRVLLILDTCEELAKVTASGPQSNIEETFRILRALHDGPGTLLDEGAVGGGNAQLRVIVSGRRPLSAAGIGWHCPTSRLPSRPFLRLKELRGFSHEEASSFLRAHGVASEELVDAVVRRSSPDAGAPFVIDYDDSMRAPHESARCNPYDLKLYFDWAREMPPPDPRTILSAGGDQYVELRIIRRLGDQDLHAVLPVVALLAHFDMESLGAACALEGDALDRIFRKLEDLEWTEARRATAATSAMGRTILSVKPGVRGRLTSYFQRRSVLAPATWERAAGYLERITRERPLSDLEWTDFDAALRVLEREPVRAESWWCNIEARMFCERSPQRALQVLDVLLEADGVLAERAANAAPEVPAENCLRPLALATYACASAQSGASVRAAEVWKVVQELARARRGEPYAALARRASACGFAVTVAAALPVSRQMLQSLLAAFNDEDAQLALSAGRAEIWAAASEAVIEFAERLAAAGDLANIKDLFDFGGASRRLKRGSALDLCITLAERATTVPVPCGEVQSSGDGEIRAFMAAAGARACLLHEQPGKAQVLFDRALGLISERGRPRHQWINWTAPDSIPDRVRLEYLHHACPRLLPPSSALAKLSPDMPIMSSETIDGERLQSRVVQLKLAEGIVDPATLGPRWFDPVKRQPQLPDDGIDAGVERCNSHRNTPVLGVSVAHVLAGTSWIELALSELENVLERGSSYRTEIVRQAARALIRIGLALRLGDEYVGVRTESVLRESKDPQDKALLKIKAVLDGSGPDQLETVSELDLFTAIGLEYVPPYQLFFVWAEPFEMPNFPDFWGDRSAGQIALTVGAIYAMQKRAGADALLEHSLFRLQRCGDRFGAFSAATLLFLERARDRRQREDESWITTALVEVETAYTALTRSWATCNLPSWQRLVEFEGATGERAFASFPSFFQPWLARALVCINIAERARLPARTGSTSSLRFQNFLLKHYGRRRASEHYAGPNASERSLPLELAGALPFKPRELVVAAKVPGTDNLPQADSVMNAIESSPAADAAYSESGIAPDMRPIDATVLVNAKRVTAALWIGGLAVVAASFWAALSPKVSPLVYVDTDTGTAMARLVARFFETAWHWQIVAAVVLGAPGFLLGKWRLKNLFVVRATRLSITVEHGTRASRRRGEIFNVNVVLWGGERAQYPWSAVGPQSARRLQFAYQCTRSGDIEEVTMSSPDDERHAMHAHLGAILQRLAESPLKVTISAPEGIQAQPFERDIAEVLNRQLHLDITARSLACLRLYPQRRPRLAHSDPFARVVLLDGLLPSRRSQLVGHFWPWERSHLSWEHPTQPQPAVSALVLDGSFEQGSAGVRFQLAEEAPASRFEPANARVTGQNVVSAERLAALYPCAGACILHYGARDTLPGTELGKHQARLARAFAGDLCRSGVDLVIVLPQGPLRNVRTLVKALRGEPTERPDRILETLHAIQSTYGTAPQIFADTKEERRQLVTEAAAGMSVFTGPNDARSAAA